VTPVVVGVLKRYEMARGLHEDAELTLDSEQLAEWRS
jgi:hypothetical protein